MKISEHTAAQRYTLPDWPKTLTIPTLFPQDGSAIRSYRRTASYLARTVLEQADEEDRPIDLIGQNGSYHVQKRIDCCDRYRWRLCRCNHINVFAV